jgi:PDZ domain-containing protein
VSTSVNSTSEWIVTPPTPPARSHSKRPWIVAVLLLVLLGFVLFGARYELPYYAYRPGSVRNTSSLISVDESKVETYDAEGSISYTTVSLRQLTLFGYIDAQLDEDVEIVDEEEVLGPRDSDENRKFNLQLMDTSKQVATQVALEKLGYEVDLSVAGERVIEVVADSPADGVMEPGDMIVAVEGEPIDEPGDLSRILSDNHPGDDVEVRLRPFTSDGEKNVELELAAADDDPRRGIMGVKVQPDGVEFHFPFDVQFDTGDVGGPSAGLAFTLGLLDKLTPGELTGGQPIAVTGTINADGTVGQIGGAAQKAAAVRRNGIEYFLVPSADYEDALSRAGDVEVIPIDTLDDAVEALEKLGGSGLPPLGPGGAPAE